jgi:hypothetical protein
MAVFSHSGLKRPRHAFRGHIVLPQVTTQVLWLTINLKYIFLYDLLLRPFSSFRIHTYRSRLIPEEVAEASQIFLLYQNYLAMRNTADVTGGLLPSDCVNSGASAINPLVAFYDIHGRKREVVFFYFVPDTIRDKLYIAIIESTTFMLQ